MHLSYKKNIWPKHHRIKKCETLGSHLNIAFIYSHPFSPAQIFYEICNLRLLNYMLIKVNVVSGLCISLCLKYSLLCNLAFSHLSSYILELIPDMNKTKKKMKFITLFGDHISLNWNLEILLFFGGRKTHFKTLGARKEPTTN